VWLIHPNVYGLVGQDSTDIRRRAALAYCETGALSHTDALDVWGLPTLRSAQVHVTVGTDAPQRTRGVHAHRRESFRPHPPIIQLRGGLPVVRLEQAIVESWPLLPRLSRRAPAIVAVRERRTTPGRLLDALQEQYRPAGAKEQRTLYGLLDAGNQSELEVWGHEQIFADKRLPRSVTQHRLEIGGQTVYLDRAFLAEMVAVELDGAAYHGSPGQRERDVRRDTAVARLGWVTLRYTHQRLHNEPDAVIQEIIDILTQRRAQLRVSA
jgi:very-short-patch-repair endonuclease